MLKNLSPAAKTIVMFSFYIWLAGLFMLFAPDAILSQSGSGSEAKPWIRVLGAVLLILGFYYFQSGRGEASAFFRATVIGRIASFPLFGLLAIAGWVPPIMAFGTLVDVLGAIWTLQALLKQGDWRFP